MSSIENSDRTGRRAGREPSAPRFAHPTRFPTTGTRHTAATPEPTTRPNGSSKPRTGDGPTASETCRSSGRTLQDANRIGYTLTRADAAAACSGHTGPASTPAVFTPAQAAELLQVRESWLRRRAAQRQVPCTFLGKHLRFSPADLERIIADAARPVPDVDSATERDLGADRRVSRRAPGRPPTGRPRRPR